MLHQTHSNTILFRMGQAPKISLNNDIQTLLKLKIGNIYFNVSFFMKQF